jgi:hypothetical protein
MPRPLRKKIKYLILESIENINAYNKKFDSILIDISNVTIINLTNIFCNSSLCQAYDSNMNHYYLDDDHLSIYFSIFSQNKYLIII